MMQQEVAERMCIHQVSILAINPAMNLSLDEIIMNGSGGAFNLQLDITFNNTTGSVS